MLRWFIVYNLFWVSVDPPKLAISVSQEGGAEQTWEREGKRERERERERKRGRERIIEKRERWVIEQGREWGKDAYEGKLI